MSKLDQNEEQKKRFEETCRKIIEQKGSCHGISCDDCPGYEIGCSCIDLRFASIRYTGVPDPKAVRSAQAWLDANCKKKPEPKKITGWVSKSIFEMLPQQFDCIIMRKEKESEYFWQKEDWPPIKVVVTIVEE